MKKNKTHIREKIRHHSMFKVLVLIFSLSSLILLTCSSPPETNNDTISFSGTVTLEDTTDFSGVTVALYAPVELDTALLRINEEYPGIGVPISQETEFDHREHQPLYTTTTKADGSWKIEGVKKGTYNIVAQKEGWGWDYEELNENNFYIDMKLLKVKVFTDNTFLLEGNRFYRVKKIVTIPAEQTLTMENNVTLLFEKDASIIIEGQVSVLGSKICLITEDSTSNKYLLEFRNQNNILIQDFIFKSVRNAVKISYAKQVSFERVLFNNLHNIGINAGHSEMKIKNCLFNKNPYAIIADFCQNLEIKNTVFHKSNSTSLEIINCDTINIINNYFNNNYGALKIVNNNGLVIQHNEFLNNRKYSIEQADSRFLITYNNFKNGFQNIRMIRYSRLTPFEGKVEYNNFFSFIEYNIILGQYVHDLEAYNNWWNTVDINEIKKSIYDSEEGTDRGTVYVVSQDYPILQSKVNNAGITL